jgi:hypothetical protein
LVFISLKDGLHVSVQYYIYCMFMCNSLIESKNTTLGVSGQRMIEAIIAGENNPEQLAELARKRLREKHPELRLALQGHVRDHHRFSLKEFLDSGMHWETASRGSSRRSTVAWSLLSRP